MLQHADEEGPGTVAGALAGAGLRWRVVRLDRGDDLPSPEDVGGVVSMGGTMGVHDDDRFPWLVDEREWLAAVVGAGRPVLGVCLGAQQLAAALGAEVTTGEQPEVGLGTVTLTPEGEGDPVLGAEGSRFPVLHWHGDTFAVPSGAVRLAASADYPNQAFRLGTRIYGLQFHVEVDRELLAAWAADLPAGVVVDEPGRAAVEAVGRRVFARFLRVATGEPC